MLLVNLVPNLLVAQKIPLFHDNVHIFMWLKWLEILDYCYGTAITIFLSIVTVIMP